MRQLLFAALLLTSCTRTIYVPITEIIKGKDSIRIEKRDSIIYIDSPVQQQNVITNQKSCLSTDYSFSLAWIDSVGLLHHSIQNTPKIPLKISRETIYKSKVDSFYINKTIPVEVVKGKTPLKAWLGWLILGLIGVWKIRKVFGV
jgi:hypothetical protein